MESMGTTPEKRAMILRLVSLLPGIHMRELQRILNVSFNSVRYNTDRLLRSGAIICEKDGVYSRLYPLGTSEKDIFVYSVIRNKTTQKILLELCDQPQITNKELSKKTGLAKSTVSEHVHELLEVSLVRLTLSDDGFMVELQDPARVGALLERSMQFERECDLVGSYTDLWDF